MCTLSSLTLSFFMASSLPLGRAKTASTSASGPRFAASWRTFQPISEAVCHFFLPSTSIFDTSLLPKVVWFGCCISVRVSCLTCLEPSISSLHALRLERRKRQTSRHPILHSSHPIPATRTNTTTTNEPFFFLFSFIIFDQKDESTNQHTATASRMMAAIQATCSSAAIPDLVPPPPPPHPREYRAACPSSPNSGSVSLL